MWDLLTCLVSVSTGYRIKKKTDWCQCRYFNDSCDLLCRSSLSNEGKIIWPNMLTFFPHRLTIAGTARVCWLSSYHSRNNGSWLAVVPELPCSARSKHRLSIESKFVQAKLTHCLPAGRIISRQTDRPPFSVLCFLFSHCITVYSAVLHFAYCIIGHCSCFPLCLGLLLPICCGRHR